jgi:hypothetical protein
MTGYNVIVSHAGTRHIVGNMPGYGSIQAHAFRITTLCGVGVRDEEGLPLSEAVRDCQFCLDELPALEQRLKQKTSHAAD